MEFINATKMVAGFTMGMAPNGRESIVVVVKGTFTIPDREDDVPALADEQVPLILADEFTGEPGFSAPVYESDYAPFKPRCDVLFNGNAYAPRGVPAERVCVELKVGGMSKSFEVVGNRVWNNGVLGTAGTPPEPFLVMPFSYDNAFGGLDETHEDPKYHTAFQPNNVGRGYHVRVDHESIDGKPLPNTEEIGREVLDANGKYRPMALGPISRSWPPRLQYAGTYDDAWMENDFPFLPADFDARYYQCAAEDQQTSYLKGGERVELINLSPGGSCRFQVPALPVPVEFVDTDLESETREAVLDTMIIEPEWNRFILCWRTSIELRRNMFEIPMIVAGQMSPGWYRARKLGKLYYNNLAELVTDWND